MAWFMLAGAAVSLLGNIMGNQQNAAAQRQQWEMQERVRKLQNLRIARAAAQSTNNVISNKVRAYGVSQQQSRAIQQEGIAAYGKAEVAAGAAGVAGNSVDRVFSSIERQEAGMEMKRQAELKNQLSAYDAQMTNIWASAEAQQNPYAMPEPDNTAGNTAMGLGIASSLFNMNNSFDKGTGTQGSMFGLGNMFSKGGITGWGAKTSGTTSSTSLPVSQEGFQPW